MTLTDYHKIWRKREIVDRDLQQRRLTGDREAEPRPLAEILHDAFVQHRSSRAAAKALGITQVTFGRWIEEEGGHFERALVLPGYDRVSIAVNGEKGE